MNYSKKVRQIATMAQKFLEHTQAKSDTVESEASSHVNKETINKNKKESAKNSYAE